MKFLVKYKDYVYRVALIVGWWGVMAAIAPAFRGEASLVGSLEFLPLLGLIALALTVPLIAGEFDLSVGSMAALAGVVAVLTSPLGLAPAVLAGTLAGGAIGALQGYGIARLPISSVAFTIGSLIVLRGVTYVLANNQPVPVEDLTLTDPLFDTYGVFTISTIATIVVYVLVGLFLAFTRFGRELYAVGGGRKEALAMGIPLRRTLPLAFMFSGGCAGLAGALATMKGGTADPSSYANMLIVGIAATLIGGVGLTGGRGTALHAFLGSLLLCVLSAGMNFAGQTPDTTGIVTGVVLLLVIAVSVASRAIRDRRSLAAMRQAGLELVRGKARAAH
ncbi:ABC transporter permease [Acrocarpospora catenulata]|uniref:ABC transporter permease n=1 Tax=Acrocarpospora catenulata TaxID=2836182 RepID=UPI001BD94DBA|nr:ABC transporter permease [Acrocarpospora catenulata]